MVSLNRRAPLTNYEAVQASEREKQGERQTKVNGETELFFFSSKQLETNGKPMNSAATRHSPTCYKRGGKKKKKNRDKTRISKRKEKSFATLFFFSSPFLSNTVLTQRKTAKGRATHEQVHEAQVFNVGFFFLVSFAWKKKKSAHRFTSHFHVGIIVIVKAPFPPGDFLLPALLFDTPGKKKKNKKSNTAFSSFAMYMVQ